LTKYEVAKELTITAINNQLILKSDVMASDFNTMNLQVAENVAAFYNKLVESLKDRTDR
jgi:hypothetical protein